MKSVIQKKFYKKILLLEYLTIAWNTVEGFVAVSIGFLSGSISLVAFGLESGIEVFSSLVTVWELKHKGVSRRKVALKLISFAFLFVSIYIFISTVNSFLNKDHAEPTILGIIYMAMVSIVMSFLGYFKRSLGKKMNNPVIIAEANFTFLDVALSSSILFGLLVNMMFDWWWIDQMMAMLIAGNAFAQGVKGVKGNKKSKHSLFGITAVETGSIV
jgi:divalent metal cation (Fe/Co/Zn/Cd) transporter